MESLNIAQKIAIWAIPVLFAITLHEVAHGFVASRLGDPTAKMMGRLTVNPIKHIDLVGTIIVPIVMLLLPGGFLFGWAKPVPVGVNNLGNPRRDMAIVGAAGPTANFLMAIFWALIVRLGFSLAGSAPSLALPFALAGVAGVFINSILMVFNLLPLPPLDGGRVAASLIPARWASVYERIEPFGFWIIIILLVTGVLGVVLFPVLRGCFGFFSLFAGVSSGHLWYLLGGLMR
ncbi:MAG: site-2 protease family protein [Gammaproteobacteria bacterium]